MSATTSNGGKPMVKSIPYSTPVGPSNLMRSGPGLHGDNHNKGQDGSNEHMTGSPGIGGINYGNCGSQGK